VYDTTGAQVGILDTWNSLYFFHKLNDFSYHTLSLQGDDPKRNLFVTDTIIEVRRYNPILGVDWYTEYTGFHRTQVDQMSDRGSKLFTSYGRSLEDLLHRRFVLYYAGTGHSTWADLADNVMKAIVNENCAVNSTTANGRLQNGQVSGLTVASNLNAAPSWSGSVSWKNVLTAVQEISTANGVDFDVVRTGAATFQFRTYYPRKGVDRSAPGGVVFSVELGNMSTPYGTVSRSEEANSIFVLGAGEESNRIFVQRFDLTAINASPWNNIEHVHDARAEQVVAALNAAGDSQLKAKKASKRISFSAIQSQSTIYGRDYFVGDLVLAKYAGIEEVKKVVGMEITVADGKENKRAHFDDESAVAI
jgi:hypothetical protein